ncbi:hypothetical protein BH20ACI3_BH20ACI3_23080 [soil metagenome]
MRPTRVARSSPSPLISPLFCPGVSKRRLRKVEGYGLSPAVVMDGADPEISHPMDLSLIGA